MKKQSITLTELQAVDLVLQLAGRERPCGFRSPLNDNPSRLPVLSDEHIEHALAVARIVQAIRPEHVRRVVVYSMTVVGGRPGYARRGIAKAMGIHERSVSRWLSDGLRQVEDAMRALELRGPRELIVAKRA